MGKNATRWLTELKRFIRGAPCWIDGKSASVTVLRPAVELVTSPVEGLNALFVDSDLKELVDLTSGEVDERSLNFIYTVTEGGQSDSSIAENVGGFDTLKARRATPYQLAHEIRLARAGEAGIFEDDGYHILYLEGRNGSLVSVEVFWNHEEREWVVFGHEFDKNDERIRGSKVYGN